MSVHSVRRRVSFVEVLLFFNDFISNCVHITTTKWLELGQGETSTLAAIV